MKGNKIQVVASWSLQLILGLLFLAAGAGKFLAAEVWIEKFNNWGYPEPFHLFIGAVELLAAILLLVPRTTRYAAFVLLGVMIGAMMTHIFHQEAAELIRPVIFAVLLGALLFLRSKKD